MSQRLKGPKSATGRYPGHCRYCTQAITYVRQRDGGLQAQDADGTNHLDHCPFGKQIRRGGKSQQSSLF